MIATEHRAVAHGDRRRRLWVPPQLLCIAGFDGFFKSLSDAWEDALDFSPSELRSCSFYAFIHADDVGAVALAACLAFGPSAVELLDQMLLDLARKIHATRQTDPNATAYVTPLVRRLASGASDDTLRNRFRCRDGTYRTLLWSAKPIVTDRTFFAAASDVTGDDERLVRRYLR